MEQPAQLARALLEAIGTGSARTLEAFQTYLKCTREGARLADSSPTTSSRPVDGCIPSSQLRQPASSHSRAPFVECCIRRALDYLRAHDLIAQKQTAPDIDCGRGAYEEYNTTQLGSAVLNSAIEIGVGLSVYRDLSRARRSLCLENDLHLVYLVMKCFAITFIIYQYSL